MKQAISIKIKEKPDPSSPSPSPKSEEYGRTILFSKIDSDGMQIRTWMGYIKFIVKFYKELNLPDENLFYWEYLSKETTINQIVKIVLSRYHIKDGNSLASKLSPFRSVVFRLPLKNTLSAVTMWGETIINVRNNFNQIIQEYGNTVKPRVKKNSQSIAKGPGNWINAYEQLHEISIDKTVDNRVRVLATIYKYGYVFRTSTIFRTYIHLGYDDSRNSFNYLDLDNLTWTIVEDNVQKVEFPIPKQMGRELRSLTNGGPFFRGWLLPQRRGIPYAPEASISSFSSWSKLGLSNYRTYRNTFNAWLKESVYEEEYLLFQGILDHHINFEEIRFIPPLPDITIKEPEFPDSDSLDSETDTKRSSMGKEIVARSGVEIDHLESDFEDDGSDISV